MNGVAQFLELDLFWGVLLLGCFTIGTSSEVNRVPRCLFAQLALDFFKFFCAGENKRAASQFSAV